MDHSRTGFEADADRLAGAIRACDARLDQIEAANRTTRWLLAGSSLALLGMAGAFGWSLWNTLQRQITPDGVEKALQSKFEEIGPRLGQKLVDQVTGVIPKYGDIAAERGQKIWPVLSAKIATEAESFGNETEAMVQQRSEEALKRVAEKLSADLKRDFPKLTEQRVEQLAKRLHDGLVTEGAGLGEEVQATITRERQRLAALLDKLPVDDAMAESDARLQKRFMHNVLMMVDQAVDEWPEDDLPAGTPRSIPADPATPAAAAAAPAEAAR